MSPLEEERAELLPLFARVLHIPPSEVDRLTLEDFRQLAGWLRAYVRAKEEEAAEIERARAKLKRG